MHLPLILPECKPFKNMEEETLCFASEESAHI
jgi:hypothetical protein